MTVDDEKKEILVEAPSRPVLSPEKMAEKKTEKAFQEEKFGVLQIPKKISKYLGITTTSIGFLMLGLFAYIMITEQSSGIILSSHTVWLNLAMWTFLGLFNVIIGFLLMESE